MPSSTCITPFVAPGELILDAISWGRDGAHVVGRVGDDRFRIEVPTGDLLNRKRFALNLWRYKRLLPILPSIEAWQSAIAAAEGGAG
jgi:hypothetical protein